MSASGILAWMRGASARTVLFATGLLALAAWTVLTGVWAGLVGWAATPIADQWDHISPHQLAGNLFEAHNEHRIIVSRLTFWVDALLFDARGVFPTALVYVFNAAHWLVLVVLAARTWPETERLRLIAASAAAVCFFHSGFQFENFSSGFQNQFTGVFFFASLSILSLAMAAAHEGRMRVGWTGACVIAALASAGSMVNGLLLFVFLPAMALLLRMRATAGLIAVLGVVVWVLYLTGYPSTSQDGMASKLIAHPIGFLANLFAYFGGAPANSVVVFLEPFPQKLVLAGVFGFAGLSGAAVIAFGVLRRWPELSPWRLAWVAILGFIIASGAVTALGRAGFSDFAMLSNRYGAGTAAFWACLTFWLVLGAPRSVAGGRRDWLLAPAALLCLIVASAQISWLGGAQNFRYRKLDVEAALLTGVEAPDVYGRNYPDPRRAPAIGEILKQQSLAMFAQPWSRLMGETLATEGLTACPGGMVSELAASPGDTPTWRASLEGRLPGRTRGVAVTDEAGRVVGLLIRGVTGDTASEPLGIRHTPRWSGYVKISEPERRLIDLNAVPVTVAGEGVCVLQNALQVDILNRLEIVPPPQVGPQPDGLLEVSVAESFAEGGQHPGLAPPDHGGRVWGSWSGDDANLGSLRFALPLAGEGMIALPVATGPRPEGTRIVATADGEPILNLLSPAGLSSGWGAVLIRTPHGAGALEIVVEDNSRGWGGWIGVGEPRIACAEACEAFAQTCPAPELFRDRQRVGQAGWIDRVEVEGGQTVVSGWAADMSTPSAAAQIVIVVDGDIRSCQRPDIVRRDVAADVGFADSLRPGFAARLPVEVSDGIEVWALQGDGTYLQVRETTDPS